MTLFFHELKRGRLSLAVWTVAIAFMLGVCVIIYPEMSSQMGDISEMFADMLRCPQLGETLSDLMPILSDIMELRRLESDNGDDDTASYLSSMTEIELYITCVDILHKGMTAVKSNLRGTAFKRLCDCVIELAESDYYRELNEKLSEMTERVREPLTLEMLSFIHHISPSYIKKLFYQLNCLSPFTKLGCKHSRIILLFRCYFPSQTNSNFFYILRFLNHMYLNFHIFSFENFSVENLFPNAAA